MIFFYEGLFYEANITMRRHQEKRTYTGWTTLDSRKVHRELLVTRTLCTRVAPRVSGALQQLCTVRPSQSCVPPNQHNRQLFYPWYKRVQMVDESIQQIIKPVANRKQCLLWSSSKYFTCNAP